MEEFLLFALVGFAAQLVDGALGMAYGLISATVLLSAGVAPAQVSASVHLAELFTTAISGTSHLAHRNVDFRLFWRLMPAGVIGGIIGAYVLTSVPGDFIRPLVVLYLGVMGALILYRATRPHEERKISNKTAGGFGLLGGFSDAVGGGGWGPMVTSALMARGGEPRFVIGTVSSSEFVVTLAISATFVWAFVSGHWEDAGDISDHLVAVGGLIAGGVLGAPLAAYLVRYVRARYLMVAVGLLVVSLCLHQGWLMIAG